MLKMLMGPEEEMNRRERVPSEPWLGGSVEGRIEFSTAKPTPYRQFSLGSSPCQKKVYLLSLRLHVE